MKAKEGEEEEGGREMWGGKLVKSGWENAEEGYSCKFSTLTMRRSQLRRWYQGGFTKQNSISHLQRSRWASVTHPSPNTPTIPPPPPPRDDPNPVGNLLQAPCDRTIIRVFRSSDVRPRWIDT